MKKELDYTLDYKLIERLTSSLSQSRKTISRLYQRGDEVANSCNIYELYVTIGYAIAVLSRVEQDEQLQSLVDDYERLLNKLVEQSRTCYLELLYLNSILLPVNSSLLLTNTKLTPLTSIELVDGSNSNLDFEIVVSASNSHNNDREYFFTDVVELGAATKANAEVSTVRVGGKSFSQINGFSVSLLLKPPKSFKAFIQAIKEIKDNREIIKTVQDAVK